jgi:glycosyltransferase involved in cell wall biosynthesis
MAIADLPESSKIKLLMAGSCDDEHYQGELKRLAKKVEGRVVAMYQWVPDNDLARYFQASDIAVFPFREITNSGSVLLAQSFGRPVVISDLPTLDDIPRGTAIRFRLDGEHDVQPLVAALIRAEQLSPHVYRDMSDAALGWASKNDWSTIARQTIEVYREANQASDDAGR